MRDHLQMNSDMNLIIEELKELNQKLREANTVLSFMIRSSEKTLESLKSVTEILCQNQNTL